jgi:uncharacterized protein (TIGR02118 family)
VSEPSRTTEPTPSTPGYTIVAPVRAGVSEKMAKRLGNGVATFGGGRLTLWPDAEDQGDPDAPWAFAHMPGTVKPEELLAAYGGCWIYRTEVHVVWEHPRRRSPDISRTVLLQRHPDIDHAEFVQRWTVGHAELARRHHPGIVRYVQRVVVDVLSDDTPPADGIASLAYHDMADFELRQYDSPEGEAIIQADVAEFLDRSAGRRIVAREQDIPSAWDKDRAKGKD